MPFSIALIGDFSSEAVAHRAIPRALELARAEFGDELVWKWVPTSGIRDAARDLAEFSAIWAVPSTPYESMEGALAAINFARESRRPFLGTCGGFQHALIEIARNVADLGSADHEESNPAGDTLVVARLSCSLVECSGSVRFTTGSRLREIYGRAESSEGYHCNFGLNAAYRSALEGAGLRFTAFDEEGEIRAAEFPASVHPFFIGTLFQPERAALRGELPPLVRALANAAAEALNK